MPAISACPDRHVLQQLLLGRLMPEEVDRLAEHVERCAACVAALNTIRVSDTLVAAMEQTTSEKQPAPEVSELIVRLCASHSPTSEKTEGLLPGQFLQPASSDSSGQDRTVSEEESYDFLAPAQEPGEIGRLGPYRILKVLGAGGMGVVFLAEDVQLRRTIALKTMRPNVAANGTTRQRFLREAQAAALLESDYIVPIYQISEDRGVPYLAMPFLKGSSLDDRLKKGASLNVRQVLRLGIQIARGLATAHEAGLIHRDIKPANIWIEPEGGGRAKILDFGLARSSGEDSQLTQSGSIVGTPAYMAPEQARGEKIDSRCDLFSLGCVLYRMLTGVQPFQGAETMATLVALAMHNPPPPIELNPALPPALSSLVMRLLSKHPADRPATAKAVVEELQAIERAIQQPDTGSSSAPPRPRTRSRLLIAGAGLLAIGLLAGIIFRITRKDGKVEEIELKPGDKIEIVEKDKEGKKPGPTLAGKGLDHLDPAKIPEAERFAWQPKELVAVIGEHRGRDWSQVRQVVYSPDGKFVATAAQGGVSLWNPQTLRQQAFLPAWDCSLAISPDSKVLAVGSGADNIRLWDVNGGEPKLRAVILIPGTSMAFSPDGNTLACNGQDKTVHLWDVTLEKPKERAVLKGHTGKVWAVAFAPDGKTFASSGEDKTFRLWDLRGDEAKEKSVTKVEVGFVQGTFSPDGKTLAWIGGGPLRLWDVTGAEPKERTRIAPYGDRNVGSVAFSVDGKTLACGVWDNRVYLYDLSGTELRQRAVLPPTARDELVAFAPDGKSLVTVNVFNGVMRLWDLTGPEPQERLEPQGHQGGVSGIAASPDGKTLISSGVRDSKIRLWGLSAGAPRQRAEIPAQADQGFALSADGKLLASLGRERAQVWDVSGAEPEERAALKGRFYATPAWSLDGKTLAIGCYVAEKPTVHLLDLTGAELKERAVLKDCYPPLVFALDGKTLFCVKSEGGTSYASPWDLTAAKPKERSPLKAEEVNPTFPAAISPDGTLLLACGTNFSAHKLVLWKLDGPKPRPREILDIDNAHDPIRGAAFAPDGKTLAVAYHGNVGLWDVSRTVSKQKRHWKFPGYVNCVSFLPDGHHLAIGNANGTIYILRLAPPVKDSK